LEIGGKAGIFYKDILDINNIEMIFEGEQVNGEWKGKWVKNETKTTESILALRPEVITPWQKKILEEIQELKSPLPFFF